VGFAVSWIAVRAAKASVLEALALTDTGRTETVPESAVCGSELPDGWYLVFLNRFDHILAKPKNLERVSTLASVVTCQVEEHVMVSEASLFENGRRVWRVLHNAQDNIYHIQTEGDLPSGFGAILQRERQQQDEEGGEDAQVDYLFEVPVELAMSICKYRHDLEQFDWGQPTYTVLEARK
jgi:hypothetical protein